MSPRLHWHRHSYTVSANVPKNSDPVQLPNCTSKTRRFTVHEVVDLNICMGINRQEVKEG